MKKNFWKKALAACLTLLLVSGYVSIKPVTDLLGDMTIRAEALDGLDNSIIEDIPFAPDYGEEDYDDEDGLDLIIHLTNESKCEPAIENLPDNILSQMYQNKYYGKGMTYRYPSEDGGDTIYVFFYITKETENTGGNTYKANIYLYGTGKITISNLSLTYNLVGRDGELTPATDKDLSVTVAAGNEINVSGAPNPIIYEEESLLEHKPAVELSVLKRGRNYRSLTSPMWEDYMFTPSESGYYRFRLKSSDDNAFDLNANSGSNVYANKEDITDHKFECYLTKEIPVCLSLKKRDSSWVGININIARLNSVIITEGIEGGTVTSEKSLAAKSEEVNLTIVPDPGYAVKNVSVNGSAVDVTNNGNDTYSFTMPDGDVTVSAEFVPCISNVSVTLKDDLGLNFIVGNVTDNNKDNLRIKLTGNCNEDGMVLPLTVKQIGDQTVYCVTANVTANHMHEEITAELYYVDGENETLIGTKKYSVYNYLKTQYDELLKLDSMSNQQRDLSILLSRTMTYGNVAEFYFNNAEKNFSILDSDNYSTFNIITLLQELGVNNLKKGLPPETVNDEAKVSLVLDSKMSARLYIKGLTAGVQDDSGEYTSVAGTKGGTDYPAYFEIQNIKVTELTNKITITYNDENYTFSPLTWAYRVLLNEKSTEKNVYMAKALALYADAAADYVNSLS